MRSLARFFVARLCDKRYIPLAGSGNEKKYIKCDHYSLHKCQLRHDSTYISNVNSWDTDSNKSFDFLLNSICIVVVL